MVNCMLETLQVENDDTWRPHGVPFARLGAESNETLGARRTVFPAPSASQSCIATETVWRRRPSPRTLPTGRSARISLSRWKRNEGDFPVEVSSDDVDDCHVLSIALMRLNMDISISGRPVVSGRREPGALLLTGPKTQTWRCTYHDGYDMLRVFIPQSLMSECHEAILGHPSCSDICLFEMEEIDDDRLKFLARALCSLDKRDDHMLPMLVESFGLLIASCLLRLGPRGVSRSERAQKPLQKWRLARVIDYIDANLDRSIYLADLSDTAGLSRMHFAAQFRAAVGCSPWTYVQQQRILRSKQLLEDPRKDIVDIALQIGFSSQAHFTAAFRRMTGTTPARWRSDFTGTV